MATREDYNANKHRTSHTRRAGNVGDGNVGDGNVGVGNVGAGTSAPAPAPPASSGPIISDDRDAEDAAEVK